MRREKRNTEAFFALLRAGLWETDVQLLPFGEVDFAEIYRLAEEQSVVGLVAGGLEHVVDKGIPKQDLLRFIGVTLQIEERNKAMNYFIGNLVEKMKNVGINTLLVKGQGIAQCYERPFWRSSGDIDLLLDEESYKKAKEFLSPLAVSVDEEDKERLHLGMTINPWIVELHGKMPFLLSQRVDSVVDTVCDASTRMGEVRVWQNDGIDVNLPKPDNDVIIVFTHFLHHFFIEGVGLRQICDWCRLLWRYQTDLDLQLLENQLRKMGLMTEWQVFAVLAVKYLGMPEGVMPFYDDKFSAKSERVMKRVLKSGNMGHNNDVSYRRKYPTFVVNGITLIRRLWDFGTLTPVFPMDVPKFFVGYFINRIRKG